VAAIAPGSAASRTDVLVGDVLIAIEGKPVLAESAPELEVVTAGPKGSAVKLTFERRRLDGTLATLDRSVRRERPGESTGVPSGFMLDSTTGYVRITSFIPGSVADDLRKTIGRLESSGMRQLVLDLRDNGGGRIDQAALAAGEFLPKGSIVYTTEGRKADLTDTGRVSRSFWKSERRYPVVILVNEGTASASELLAGALQDHDRAIVVGRPTFGKALVMRGFPMTDGSVVVLVVGQLRTPCGRIVQRQYREITRRDYFRLAAADRDTAGRSSCKTDAGRTVYGGGGIYPDVRLEFPAGPPDWASRILGEDLPLTWAGGWVTSNGAMLTTMDDLAKTVLPAGAIADFRALATARGIVIPNDEDKRLQQILLETVAFVKFGEAGVYRLAPRFDREIVEAVKALSRPELLRSPKQ
jgi:carboxyl-terminal processing protease